MRTAVVFEASRDGYSIGQIDSKAMTVGELKDILCDYEDDDIFVLSHDNGYTYGSISRYTLNEAQYDEDSEKWEVQ